MNLSLNKLEKVKDNSKKRIGRGIGSGKGKTSGRGVKGQKARTGSHCVKGFEGGQTPIYMRLPKKGFKSISDAKYQEVSTKSIFRLIESKSIDPSSIINKKIMFASGLIFNESIKVKLISSSKKYDLKDGVKVAVDLYSKSASKYSS